MEAKTLSKKVTVDSVPQELAMDHWKLPSNSGWNMTSWLVRESVTIQRSRYLLVEIVLTGRYWNRSKLARKDFTASDLVKEYSVILSQVLVAESAVKRLRDQLSKWVRTPINKFAATTLQVKEELAGLDSQMFKMEFGPQEDLIVDVGHTVCTISYKMNALAGQCSYVVDQSCVQTFIDGLDLSIKATHNKRRQPTGE